MAYVKPPPGTPLDWATPLAAGLVDYLAYNEGSGAPCDLAQPADLPALQGSPSWAATPAGPGLRNTAGNSSAAGAGALIPDHGNLAAADVTVRVRFVLNALPTSTYSALYEKGTGGGGELSLFLDTAGAVRYCTIGGTSADSLSRGSFAAGALSELTLTRTGTTCQVYQDGLPAGATFTLSGTSGSSGLGLLVGGQRTGVNGNCDATVVDFAVWSRALSPAEVLAAHGDPNFAFPRQPVRRFFVPSSGSTASGAGSADGLATASGVGASLAASAGSAAGAGTASGAGASLAASAGSAAGAATASASSADPVTAIATLKGYWKSDAGLYQDTAGTTPAVANTDPVARWEDQSGNGYHLTQSTTGQRPTLKTGLFKGLPAVDFDSASTQWLTNASFPETGSKGSGAWVVAVQIDVDTPSAGVVTSTQDQLGILCAPRTVYGYLNSAAAQYTDAEMASNQGVVLCLSYDGSQSTDAAKLRLFKNHTQLSLAFHGSSIPATTYTGGTDLYFGRQSAGGYLKGRILAAAFFSSLSDADCTSVTDYFGARYFSRTTYDLICQGDSRTAGYPSNTNNTPPLTGADSYPLHAEVDLGTTDWTLRNAGVSGQQFSAYDSAARTACDPYQDDWAAGQVLVAFGGTNDFVAGRTVAQVESDITTWVANRKAAGFAHVYVGTQPYDSASTSTGNIGPLNTWILANSAGADRVVDFGGDARFDDITDTSNTTYYNADGVHFTDAGHAALAGILVPVVQLDYPTPGSGTGSADGSATASAVGSSLAASAGTASGSASASALGSSLASAAGTAAGAASASGVGSALASSAGSADGLGTASGVGAPLASAAGTAAGVATASGVSGAAGAGTGTAAGGSSASGVGAATAASAGTSAGAATASATGSALASAAGTASGLATASGVGSSSATGSGAGSASGVATAAAVGASLASSAGTSAGLGTANGVGATTASAAGTASGLATASGAGSSTASGSGVGTAAGSSTASGVGAALASAAGTAAGASSASAVGDFTASGAAGTAAGSSAASAVGASLASAAGTAAGSSSAVAVPPAGTRALIRRALYARLTASADVAGIVGPRVFPLYVPEGEAFPALTYQLAGLTRERGLLGPTGISVARFLIAAVSRDLSDCELAAEAVRQTLDGLIGVAFAATDGSTITVLGTTLNAETDTQVFAGDGSDRDVFRTVLDYTVRYREPAPA